MAIINYYECIITREKLPIIVITKLIKQVLKITHYFHKISYYYINK